MPLSQYRKKQMKIDTKEERVLTLTTDKSFIAAEFNKDEDNSFEMSMHAVNGKDIFNMMSHMAIALKSNSSVTIEQIAQRLVEDQGNFKQEERAW